MTPDLNIYWVKAPKKLVDAIDALIEVANKNGSKGQVETSKDWQTVEFIYKMFSAVYPYQEKLFLESMKFYRSMERFNKGVSEEAGGASIQHQLEVPQKLYQMMKIIFPNQVWTKKFVKKLAAVLPQLKPNEAGI